MKMACKACLAARQVQGLHAYLQRRKPVIPRPDELASDNLTTDYTDLHKFVACVSCVICGFIFNELGNNNTPPAAILEMVAAGHIIAGL
jgi:hypothetical protein